jgi:hypothetical protein
MYEGQSSFSGTTTPSLRRAISEELARAARHAWECSSSARFSRKRCNPRYFEPEIDCDEERLAAPDHIGGSYCAANRTLERWPQAHRLNSTGRRAATLDSRSIAASFVRSSSHSGIRAEVARENSPDLVSSSPSTRRSTSGDADRVRDTWRQPGPCGVKSAFWGAFTMFRVGKAAAAALLPRGESSTLKSDN